MADDAPEKPVAAEPEGEQGGSGSSPEAKPDGESPPARPGRQGRPAKRPDRASVIVRAVLIVGTLAIGAYIVVDYILSYERVSATPAPMSQLALPVPKRAVSPGGWLHGLERVSVEGDRPWVKVGMEIQRRKLTPPVSPKGMALKEAFLFVALFTDGTYVPLRDLGTDEVRAIVCAGADEKYGGVRGLFGRCMSGGSPVALVLARVGNDPAAIPVTLGALPLVKDSRRVQVEVAQAPGGLKVTANGFGCSGLEDLTAKLEKLRKGDWEVLVRLSVADSLPTSTFVDAVAACGAPKETVYVALTELR